jgi:hypothetical protein
MQMNSNFNFHLETLKRDCQNIFDDKTYDAILHAAKILFGTNQVTYNERSIFIKDKICIELSFSWNETKAYIYTYHDLDMMEGEPIKERQEVNYQLRSLNPSFRLFGLKQIIEYLQIKEIENRFIRENEG